MSGNAQRPHDKRDSPPGMGHLSGVDKAAALLVALNPDVSAKVLKGMKEHEVEELIAKITQLQRLSDDDLDAVVRESRDTLVTQGYVGTGGIEHAREMLERAFGQDRASSLIGRVAASQVPAPFEFLRRSDPREIALFMQNEHPQTVALILSYLPPSQAASVLTNLSESLQADVARRIATMDRTPPHIVEQVEEVIRRRLSSVLLAQDTTSVGGTDHLVSVLMTVDRGTEKNILDRLAEIDPALSEQVRQKMFTFDDIIMLDDRSVQRVLREVDSRDLALALKAARDDLKEHIFSNMSTRAAETLREEISFSGPVRIRNVEEAQQRIVAVVRRLEEAEEIIISRGEEGAFLG